MVARPHRLSWPPTFIRTACIALSLLIASCATEPHALPVPPATNSDTAPRSNHIFAVGHGWHVGLVLPAKPLEEKIPELKLRFPQANYLELGWGDKGFYQAQEITTGLTLRAMFWSSGAVIHAVALPPSSDPPFDYFTASDIVELCVSDRELAALNEFVSQSFRRDAAHHAIKMKEGIYGDSQFYEGEGRYHFMNTCNKWVAKGLATMGFSVDPTWKLTSASVLDWLKQSGRAVRRSKDGVMVAPLGHSGACEASPAQR